MSSAFEQQVLRGVGGQVVAVQHGDVRTLAGLDRERQLRGDVGPLLRDVLDDDVVVLGVELLDELRHERGRGATRPAVPEA